MEYIWLLRIQMMSDCLMVLYGPMNNMNMMRIRVEYMPCVLRWQTRCLCQGTRKSRRKFDLTVTFTERKNRKKMALNKKYTTLISRRKKKIKVGLRWVILLLWGKELIKYIKTFWISRVSRFKDVKMKNHIKKF